jgi:hypothetical protein
VREVGGSSRRIENRICLPGLLDSAHALVFLSSCSFLLFLFSLFFSAFFGLGPSHAAPSDDRDKMQPGGISDGRIESRRKLPCLHLITARSIEIPNEVETNKENAVVSCLFVSG